MGGFPCKKRGHAINIYNPPLILLIKLIKLKPEEEKHYQLASTCTLLLQLDQIKKYTLTHTQKEKEKRSLLNAGDNIQFIWKIT
jgi:hypothetical protein